MPLHPRKMETINQSSQQLNGETMSKWFDNFISNIFVHRIMMETDTAPSEIKQLYTDAMIEDYHSMSKTVRDQSTKYFIVKLVEYYFEQLKSFEISPQKLAFDFSDAKILVWAQISDEDDKSENALILSEARANLKYLETGFYISSTIVEESDNLEIPSHYHELKIHGRLSSPY